MASMNLFLNALLSFLLSASIVIISSPFPQGVLGLNEAAALPIEAGVPYYLVPLNADITRGGITLISLHGDSCPVHVALGDNTPGLSIVFSIIKINGQSYSNITEEEDVSIRIYNVMPDCANTSVWQYDDTRSYLPPAFVRINGENIGHFGTRFRVKRVTTINDEIDVFKLQGYRSSGGLLLPVDIGLYKNVLVPRTDNQPLLFTLLREVTPANNIAGYKSAM
ncbi:hypothetical protein Tsubulata_043318 [Turnera subulata]|uniref:Uncharacterized protein n=1 Tax=Turnera subulata TaxID=218843 RepID=A0A9Q0GF53_9ROSI|nr:hypothetical protein Tsubulata_043318 [Turnera subulata]